MANIGLFAAKNMLDWSLKVSSIATPASVFIGLSLGAPVSTASSEVGTGSGYLRQAMSFVGAATPAGSGFASASNSTAATFGPFSSSAVVSGIFLADTVSSNAGNLLWFGNLATVRTPLPSDQLVVNAAALGITLG